LNHKLSSVVLLCACVLGSAVSLWGQEAGSVRGVPGYLDPRTGQFHSARMTPTDLDSDLTPALTTFGGKLVFKFTITVDSAIAAAAKIGCSASANLVDAASGNFILESATVAAIRSGTTATCTVTIPYSWKLASAASDSISLTYDIQAPVEATSPATTLPNRVSSQSLPAIKVPPNGATTNETITATI
jgi:uncharacterized Zn-finger protein